MTAIDPDPLGVGGLAEFGRRFRSGELSSEAATRAYLSRIDKLDPRLGAFEYVATETAVASARAIDALWRAGTDLGPLMGVPIAIKDLLAVDGMPTTAGTNLDVADLIGPQGPVVSALRAAGTVILGKTKTVEFALGATGVSATRGTPVNPWDSSEARLPGGSSSGSGVAVAAGLCAFAIGSDTGGSVRVPAALNGVFGMKTTTGVLPNDGAFPLARHLDSIGYLTRSAKDAAIVHATLTRTPAIRPASFALRLGKPVTYFFDGISDEVHARTVPPLTPSPRPASRFSTSMFRKRQSEKPIFPSSCLPIWSRNWDASGPQLDLEKWTLWWQGGSKLDSRRMRQSCCDSRPSGQSAASPL